LAGDGQQLHTAAAREGPVDAEERPGVDLINLFFFFGINGEAKYS